MASMVLRCKLIRYGNGLALRIPMAAARRMGITVGSEVTVAISSRAMTPRRVASLDELLEGVTPANAGSEIHSGPPRGREVW